MNTEFLSEVNEISINQVMQLIKGSDEIVLSDSAIERMDKGRDFLERSLQDKSRHYYGINTGFGSLYNVRISDEQVEKLQYNLVVSHACGTGDALSPDLIRIMMLLKIRNLALGYSGARVALVNKLIELYNRNIIPVIYEQGSLGASGDLAPLAHLSLPLIGDGEVYYDGSIRRSEEVFGSLGIEKLVLQSKEGLAMLNGTQFSTSFGVFGANEGERLAGLADICAVLSLEAFNCNTSPFDPLIHGIRAHKGQVSVAARLNNTFKDSDITSRRPKHVQDPYSFRCVPQVHGATADVIDYVKGVVNIEINSVTDNPSIFAEEEKIISAGNFHAQPIALALDFLAIGLSELASISERRCFQLLDGKRGLPPFLTPDPGVNSGYMILQYTAASIVSQNKQLCSPASVDSIVSCSGQEDHVSMAANAGTKLYRVVKNLETVLAIEFMIAVQALDIRKYRINPILRDFIAEYRLFVPFLEQDRPLSEDIKKTKEFLSRTDIGSRFN